MEICSLMKHSLSTYYKLDTMVSTKDKKMNKTLVTYELILS